MSFVLHQTGTDEVSAECPIQIGRTIIRNTLTIIRYQISIAFRVGSDKSQDIQLSGMFILPEHCMFSYQTG